jgi:radical SAM protein with 4Fe4S-binding SPASM domain
VKANIASGLSEPAFPFLFSFITLRGERFGAIVFNPFLDEEIILNPLEACIASALTGTNSTRDIENAIGASFNLSGRESEARVSRTLRRLSGIIALGFREGVSTDGPVMIKKPRYSKKGPYLSAPRSVTWEVTYACNLHCPHCFTESGTAGTDELDTRTALKLVDALADAKVLRLLISGGEPFLRPDILTILRGIADTGMRIDIATNGRYLPKKVLAGLRDLPVFHAHVSIDGLGDKHDRFRGSEGAFEAACGTVRKLQEEGVDVSLSTTVTRENIDELDRIIDLALALGCGGFFANAMLPVGRGRRNADRYMLDVNGYYRMYRILVKRGEELRDKLAISTDMCFPFLLSPPVAGRSPGESMGCSAGNDTLCIGADGTAYPCHFLHDFPLGKLPGEPLDRIWKKSPVLEGLRSLRKQDMAGECRECGYAPVPCRGGCRAAAYLADGDIRGKDATCFKTLIDNG